MERTAGVIGRSADGRWRPTSFVVAIRTRTECGERIVCQTALGSVTVWRTAQQIDSTVFVSRITHSTHCTNSELGVSPRFAALSIFIQQSLTWKCRKIALPVWTGGHVTSRNTVANRWKQVNTARKTGSAGRWRRSRLRQRRCGAQPMCTQVQSVTGTNRYANM